MPDKTKIEESLEKIDALREKHVKKIDAKMVKILERLEKTDSEKTKDRLEEEYARHEKHIEKIDALIDKRKAAIKQPETQFEKGIVKTQRKLETASNVSFKLGCFSACILLFIILGAFIVSDPPANIPASASKAPQQAYEAWKDADVYDRMQMLKKDRTNPFILIRERLEELVGMQEEAKTWEFWEGLAEFIRTQRRPYSGGIGFIKSWTAKDLEEIAVQAATGYSTGILSGLYDAESLEANYVADGIDACMRISMASQSERDEFLELLTMVSRINDLPPK